MSDQFIMMYGRFEKFKKIKKKIGDLSEDLNSTLHVFLNKKQRLPKETIFWYMDCSPSILFALSNSPTMSIFRVDANLDVVSFVAGFGVCFVHRWTTW